MRVAVLLSAIGVLWAAQAHAWDYSNDPYANDPYNAKGEPNYRYEGSSGQRYQYDLSRPMDQLRYETDIQAQMRDELNVSPRIDLDRGIDQYGGGAQRW